MAKIVLDMPNTQIDFANALIEIRTTFLQDALSATVSQLRIRDVDDELYRFADDESLKKLAQQGMRGRVTLCRSLCAEKVPAFARLLPSPFRL